MATRRMLSKSISTSIRVNRLSTNDARLLFTWLIPHCDDDGRIQGDPLYIKGTVIPMIDCKVKDVEIWLLDLVKNSLIEWYEIEGEKYIQVLQWFDHQTIQPTRKVNSKIPPCQQNVNKPSTQHHPNIIEDNIREDKVSKANVDTVNIENKNLQKKIDELWSIHPQPSSRYLFETAMFDLSPDDNLFQTIKEKLKLMVKSEKWTRDNYRFCPALHNWINHKGWLDAEKPKGEVTAREHVAKLLKLEGKEAAC